MKALVKCGPGVGADVLDVPVPGLSDGTTRVRPVVVGICGSDVETYLWRESRRERLLDSMPVVLGHEVIGRVTEVGPGSTLSVGQLVASDPVAPCLSCRWCQRGDTHLCVDRRSVGYTVDGGLSEDWVAPTSCLVPVPDELAGSPLDELVLLEVLAIACHVADKGGAVAGRTCAVVGAGPLGTLLCSVLRARGAASVVAAGTLRSRKRLKVAAGRGATETAVSDAGWIQQNTDRFDLVFEVAGTVAAFMACIEIVDRGGRLVFASGLDELMPIKFNTQIKRREVEIVGATAHPRPAWQEAFEFARSGEVSLAGLVDASFRLEDAAEAVRRASEREFFKAVVWAHPE